MTRIIALLFLFISFAGCLMGLAGCQPPGVAPAEIVRSFRVTPVVNTFARPVDIHYQLAAPVEISLYISSAAPEHAPVLTLHENLREAAGSRHAAWRGIGPDGFFVPQGTYHVELIARHHSGHAERYRLPVFIFRN